MGSIPTSKADVAAASHVGFGAKKKICHHLFKFMGIDVKKDGVTTLFDYI